LFLIEEKRWNKIIEEHRRILAEEVEFYRMILDKIHACQERECKRREEENG